MQTYRPTTWIALAVGALLLAANYSFAHSSFQRSAERQAERRPESDYLRLPAAHTFRALFAGFDTMAADAAWMLSLVHYGPRKPADPTPKYLVRNAETIAELDPHFYDVYPWFSGTYVHDDRTFRIEDIEELNEFLDQGIERFPDDYWLRLDAGMNYIGYVKYRTAREKLTGYDRAIDYLQRAATLQGAPSHLPLTVSMFHSKRRRLRTALEGDDETAADDSTTADRSYFDFLSQVYYLVEDESVRRSIRSELESSPAGRRALKRLQVEYSQELDRRRSESFSYLPVDLWITIAAPMNAP